MTQVTPGRPLPPPRHSRVGGIAAQWGPQIIGVATLLISAIKFNDDALKSIRDLQVAASELRLEIINLKTELERQRKVIGEQNDELAKQRTKQDQWRTWAEAGFCALRVKAPGGCPDVEYEPRPLRGSNAPVIQPKVHLDLDQ